MVFYTLGWTLKCEGVLLLLPLLTAFLYQEDTTGAFLLTILLCLGLGFLLARKKPENGIFHLREGFVSVALGWVVISLMGALPFLFSGAIPHVVDAIFETVSGFTTTGASILTDVESLPKSILFWRSFTHWIGGMGVLVFLLTLLPMTGGSHMNLMKAESPGPQVEKLVPRVRSTAMILYGIYLALTVLEVLLLLAGGAPLFDALTTAFGTAGTGGFGIRNDSITSYSTYIQVVVTVFMILFGINFNFYFMLLLRRFGRALRNEEVRAYLLIILVSVLLIGFNIRELYGSLGAAMQQAAFQVGSIITTTGFSTADFGLWPQLSQTILVVLMFVGACAGSTGGGIKVSRLVILAKSAVNELRTCLHPRSVRRECIDGRPLSHEVVHSVYAYMVAYLFVFGGSVLLITLDGFDLITNFTAVAATLNNIGPGLELVGPAQNFALFGSGAKLILIFDMLAGRLELFPILLLFLPDTWKRF